MNATLDSSLGRYLWRLLPEVYRQRDNGDLAHFVDCCGRLLDQVRATLDQRLRDTHPDECQTWLIPYFARLLDVQLVSPEDDGRRREVANAVDWRQRKGTLACVEEIAEAVAQMEVELQEGWERVACTARVGEPLLAAAAYGEREPLMTNPLRAARHPALPAVTVDLRYPSRAQRLAQPTAVSRATRYPGEPAPVAWQQFHRHGAPCFPGSYEDVSRRTVDLRNPDWRVGHHHPRRLLLYAPPPPGFFPAGQPTLAWSARDTDAGKALLEQTEIRADDGMRVVVFRALTAVPLRITGRIDLDEAPVAGERLVFRFENLYLMHTLTVAHARVQLERTAAFTVHVQTADTVDAVLTARDCLVRRVRAPRGRVQLEYCTVLAASIAEVLQASDCLLLGEWSRGARPSAGGSELPQVVCLRYSRVPASLAGEARAYRCTSLEPVFFNQSLGRRGCGVLHPVTPAAIRGGAEDGTEIGAYHHRRYCLGAEAVRDKLSDFLPVGIVPVVIYDERLDCAPPA